MAVARSYIVQVVESLFTFKAKQAIKYISPTETVKATYQGKRNHRKNSHTVVLTMGQPNFKERQFIKLCKKAGEKFPIRKVQLRITRAK